MENSYKLRKCAYLRTWPNSPLRKAWENGAGAATGQPCHPPRTLDSVVTLTTSSHQDSEACMDSPNGSIGAGATGFAGSCQGLLWFSWWQGRPCLLPRPAKEDSSPLIGRMIRHHTRPVIAPALASTRHVGVRSPQLWGKAHVVRLFTITRGSAWPGVEKGHES